MTSGETASTRSAGRVPAGAVVVGVDGSSWAAQARDWAAHQAELEGRPLVLAHAVSLPTGGLTTYLYREHLAALRAESQRYLEGEVKLVREEHEGLEVHPLLLEGDPRSELLAAAGEASLLVLGSRGLGPVSQLLLGSVSHALTRHVQVPVLVLRPGDAVDAVDGVLVGIAGDDRDDAAVELAFRLAEARGLPVTLLHCSYGGTPVVDDRALVPEEAPGFDRERAVVAAAARAPAAAHPSVPVRHLVARGFPNVQLVEESAHAELVVLGHRRKKVLRELVHASVAPHVAEHAHCSVVVAPSPEPTGLPRPDRR